MRERFPELKEEEKKNNTKYVSHYSIGPAVLISKTRPYLTPDDLKGGKVKFASHWTRAGQLDDWKVTQVNLSFPETYSALERGTIDGATTYMTYIEPLKHNEVAQYATEPELGQHTNVMLMNQNTWESLSEKEQQCFNQLEDEFRLRLARLDMEETDQAREQLSNHPKHPMEIHQLTEAQRQQWERGLTKSADQAVERIEKIHPAAREIFDAYLQEQKKVAQEVAEKGYPWQRN